MVLESLLYPKVAEQNPWKMLFVGFLYTIVGALLSFWIFADQASLVMVFLIVMAAIPITYKTMVYEESKDLIIDDEAALLKEHNRAISFFMYLFLGITLAGTLLYIALPSATTAQLFQKQTQTISTINNAVSGNAYTQLANFNRIFFNNMRVLVFSLIFGFVYSAGAIFILTWNATVISTAIGNFIRTNLSTAAQALGFFDAGGYLHIVSLGLIKYAVHGIPEIMAYFYGGLAGGILSAAIIKKHFNTKKAPHILADFFELLMISAGFLIAGAFLEVYVTPVLF